jgi:hypothetical protein
MSTGKSMAERKSMTGRIVEYPRRSKRNRGNAVFCAEFSGGRTWVTITGDLAQWTMRLKMGERITITSFGRDWAYDGHRGIATPYITKAADPA